MSWGMCRVWTELLLHSEPAEPAAVRNGEKEGDGGGSNAEQEGDGSLRYQWKWKAEPIRRQRQVIDVVGLDSAVMFDLEAVSQWSGLRGVTVYLFYSRTPPDWCSAYLLVCTHVALMCCLWEKLNSTIKASVMTCLKTKHNILRCKMKKKGVRDLWK